MQRYWISQGLLGGQGVVVVGGEGEGEELVQGAMWEAKKPEGGGGGAAAQAKAEESASDGEGLEEEEEEEEEAGKKKIAWRYGGMGKFKTTVDSSSSSGELELTFLLPPSLPSFELTFPSFVLPRRKPTPSTTPSPSLITSPSRLSLLSSPQASWRTLSLVRRREKGKGRRSMGASWIGCCWSSRGLSRREITSE